MTDASLSLTFLGTGTSAGVPMIGCKCETCTSTDPRDHRTRPSVFVTDGQTTVLIDTTPELRLQALANRLEHIDALLYTHAHADHIMGLDDVRRFNAIKRGPLDVFAEPHTFEALFRIFGYAFIAPDPASTLFRPHLVSRDIDGPFEVGTLRFQPLRLMHGSLPILGFRIGRVGQGAMPIAYCTDVNFIPDETWPLLKDLDVLVLDALQPRIHATHFNLEQAIEAAEKIGAKHTYFTHLAHGVKHDVIDPSLPPGMHLGYDGLRVG